MLCPAMVKPGKNSNVNLCGGKRIDGHTLTYSMRSSVFALLVDFLL